MQKRIMIVDDDLATRVMLRDLLERDGHEVVAEAASGDEVLENYRKSQPDLVIMDIVLPVRNGIEVTGLLRAVDRKARIIVISALGDIPLIKAAFASGAMDFIQKPFTPEKILEAVQQAVAAE
ncbi:MAG TPA: response regulator [Geobacteraceae bacterium]